MKNLTVSVIIPNFNGESLLEKNLPFILKAKEDLRNNIIEIIVVDDGSSDGSAKLIISKFPQIKLIKHKVNRGFSAAVNTGARTAKGDLLCLLNSDVAPENNFLESVFLHFRDPKVFAVSLHEKGFGWAKASFSEGYIQLVMGKEDVKVHLSFYVSGGSGVFRREYWMKLSGMDEKLLSPFYWEDIEICYRAEKRGYINLWEPEGNVMHNHESTIVKFSKIYVQRVRERNQLLMIWKNIHSAKLIRNHVIGVVKRLVKHPGYIRIVFMALGKLGVVVRERKKEIKLSKVSDEAIFSRF
jgi:GT2 family glycosyltransferase